DDLIIWFDYGLLHLFEPLVFNQNVMPVDFPLIGGDIPTTGCVITGWGRTEDGKEPVYPEELREASVSILPSSSCKYQHSTILCLTSGACWYDWGAPVTCTGISGKNIVIGYATAVYKTCAQTAIASVVSLPLAWLDIIFAEAKDKCRNQKPPPAPAPPPPPPPPTRPPPATTTSSLPGIDERFSLPLPLCARDGI
ncbi:unnamed protein product, partial [Allacma fusca]